MIRFQEAAVLFHFTDTARLPWILETGELPPGVHQVSRAAAGFPLGHYG